MPSSSYMVETVVSFDELKFFQEKDSVRARFLGRYYFLLANNDLLAIAPFEVKEGSLVFAEREKRTWNRLTPLLDKGFEMLAHSLHDKECLYIHRGSGIPLIGSPEFGIIDRGTNILEVKPLTGCNLACTFCSISEGGNSEKRDILIEESYLVEVFAELAKLKKHPVEANIGPQGEPLLYPKIVDLVKDLKAHGAAVVSLNTNGTLLSEDLIEKLAASGLDRINLSVHAVDQELENKLMGGVQDLDRLRRLIAFCEGKIDVLLAPVIIPGFNDNQFDGLIALAKTIKNKSWPVMGVQNFLQYPGGRNPGTMERSWEEFYNLLEQKEREFGLDLTLKGEEQKLFGIFPEETLEKPFGKNDIITVTLLAKGRNRDEWLGVAAERVVTIRNLTSGKKHSTIKVRVLRDKHNIFSAVPL
jgi:uncharacterized Fe-S cluster-containing radical SAM superfamily enzyme